MSNKIKIELMGIEEIEEELQRLYQFDKFDKLNEKHLTAIFNRGMENTPVGDYKLGGQLRKTLTMTKDEVGYTEEYAPHVEYGHKQQPGKFIPVLKKRLKASYVQGRYFFKKNVDEQREIYHEDLKRKLKKERGEF